MAVAVLKYESQKFINREDIHSWLLELRGDVKVQEQKYLHNIIPVTMVW